MRKTNISQYSSASSGAKMPFSKKRKNKNLRIATSSLKIIWRLLFSLVTVFVITGTLIFISLWVYKSKILENDIALNINASKMPLTSFVYINDENGNPQEYQKVYNTENRVWINFQDIPANMKNAIIAIEDKRFYEHHGVDWMRTSGAMFNLLKGTYGYGGSTLTQQLVKNITEDNKVSLTRKLREIFRAIELEERYSKDEILESYLNVVNFGSGTRGVQAAANLYFNKNIQECSLAECAAIAAITQNPAAYNPVHHPDNNKSRREIVLKEMLDQNKISHGEYDSAVSESSDIKFSENSEKYKKNSSASVRNWYVESLIKDVVTDLCDKYRIGKSAAEDMIYTQGLKIYSAMDAKAQSIAENALKDPNIMAKDPNLELGYMMMDFNGRILATIGSRKEKTANLIYDRANAARRQPGSTIKPLAAYTPAIDLGIYNYSSIIMDEPLQIDSDGNNVIKNWPKNWYKSYKGPVTLQWAIEKSANAPPAQIVKFLTPFKSYEFLTKKLGFTSLDSSDAASLSALAGGGTHFGVTLREMIAAFQIFGNGGKYNKPHTYFYVTDRSDKVILDNRDAAPVQAVASSTATIMNRLLRNVVIGPEGTGRSANIPGWNIVGKTGTTTDDYDSWFMGLSPYAVAGIWTGYDNPKRIRETTTAIRVWKHIMTKYLENKTNKDFTYDKNVVSAQYCKTTGKIASNTCKDVATGYYISGNMPESCTSHPSGAPESAKTEETPPETASGESSVIESLPPEGEAEAYTNETSAE